MKKTMTIAEILTLKPESISLFEAHDMHCLGCARATSETLEEACASHDVDVDAFLEQLNALA